MIRSNRTTISTPEYTSPSQDNDQSDIQKILSPGNDLTPLGPTVSTHTKMDSKQQKKETDSSETPPADTMTGRDLEKMLNKGVKPSDTDERIEQFVRWRIQDYNENNWESLSDIFAEEFRLFAKEDFEALSKEQQYGLRNCLRNNGVYVKKGRGVSMAESLANVVQEETPWPLNDEDRPPPKHQQYYPPQQQPIQPQQPYQQPYRPENTVPLPPQPPYQPIVEDTTPVHPPPTPIVEDITPVHPPPTPSDGPPRQPQQQPMQSIQEQQPYRPENTIPLPPQPPYQPENHAPILPSTPNYGPDYRVPHLLPSPYQVIQDSSPVNTSQLSAASRPRTISTLREPIFSLSNLGPPFASQHAHFLAPLFASQHGHFLAS